MTSRERLKLKLLVLARKYAPTSYEQFRKSSLESMDDFDDELQK